MPEEETIGVEEQLEATAEATESAEHNDVSDTSREAEQQKRTDAEYNWAEMRRQMREKDQEIAELRQQYQTLAKPPKKEEEDDEFSKLAEDDIVTVGQAKKLSQKMAKRVAEEVIKARDAATVEERMQMRYSDYSQVVSKENLEYLNKHEPELLASLQYIPDPTKQAVAAYKMLKQFGKKEDKVPLERRKAQENAQKPVSVNAVTQQSAIGNAHLFENGLTKELKSQLWKEIQECSKRA